MVEMQRGQSRHAERTEVETSNATAAASAHYKSVKLCIPNDHFVQVGVKGQAHESEQCTIV